MSYKQFSITHKIPGDEKLGDESKNTPATDQPVKASEAPAIVTPAPKS